MGRSLQRNGRALLLMFAAALALSAFTAGTAGAAINRTPGTVPAVTGGSFAVAPTSAYVYGAVDTYNEATDYSFEFGTTTGYGHFTAAAQIPAGKGLTVVYTKLTGLKPSTTYHYRLVVDPIEDPATGYYYTGANAGADVTFKTTSAGKLTLSSTKLKVKSGKTSFTVKSTSTIAAKAKFTLTAKGKKIGSGSFSVNAGKSKTVSFKLTSKGKSLLKAAKNKLKATLKVTTSTYQTGFSKKVTLT